MIGLLVTVAVINIALGVAVTSWVTLDRRAREAELLWRGRKYVRALRCHQQETGALPVELEELLESDCIRRLWPDPMTGDGEWELVRLGDVAPEREGEGDGLFPGPGQDGPFPGQRPFGSLAGRTSFGRIPLVSGEETSGSEGRAEGEEPTGFPGLTRARSRLQTGFGQERAADREASEGQPSGDETPEGTGPTQDRSPDRSFMTPEAMIRWQQVRQQLERLRGSGAEESAEFRRLAEQLRALEAEAGLASGAQARQAALLAELARAQGGEEGADPETGRAPASAQSLLEALQAQRERLTGSLRDSELGGRNDSRSIVGVVSRSEREGFRTYRGSRLYSEWRFMVQGGTIR